MDGANISKIIYRTSRRLHVELEVSFRPVELSVTIHDEETVFFFRSRDEGISEKSRLEIRNEDQSVFFDLLDIIGMVSLKLCFLLSYSYENVIQINISSFFDFKPIRSNLHQNSH